MSYIQSPPINHRIQWSNLRFYQDMIAEWDALDRHMHGLEEWIW